MLRNSDKITFGVKFDLKFDFPCPISYMARNFRNSTTISCTLANFLLRMRRNGLNCISGLLFNPKFEIPMGCFLFEYEIWWVFRLDLYVF